MPARLVIRRPSGGAADLLRSYRIEVDGRELGKLRRDQALDVELPAGHHRIRVRIDWASSPELPLDLQEGETRVVSNIALALVKAFTRPHEYLRLRELR